MYHSGILLESCSKKWISKKNPISVLSTFCLLLSKQASCYRGIQNDIKQIEGLLKNLIKDNLMKLDLVQLIQANYICYQLRIEFIELVSVFRNGLLRHISVLEIQLDANFIVLAAEIAYNVIPHIDKEKPRLLRGLAEMFAMRDSVEYDLTLQHTEFVEDEEAGSDSVNDRLTWDSIRIMIDVYSNDDNYQENILDRVSNLIIRKSESGLIDIDNATAILMKGVQSQSLLTIPTYMRLLEMINWQVTNEDVSILDQFTGANITNLLTSISSLVTAEWDIFIVTDIFSYFSQVIQKDSVIQQRLSKQHYVRLNEAYENTSKYIDHNERIMNFIKKNM